MVAVSFQSSLAQLVHTCARLRLATEFCAHCVLPKLAAGGLFLVAFSLHLSRRFRDLRISVGAGKKEQVFVAAQICNSEF